MPIGVEALERRRRRLHRRDVLLRRGDAALGALDGLEQRRLGGFAPLRSASVEDAPEDGAGADGAPALPTRPNPSARRAGKAGRRARGQARGGRCVEGRRARHRHARRHHSDRHHARASRRVTTRTMRRGAKYPRNLRLQTRENHDRRRRRRIQRVFNASPTFASRCPARADAPSARRPASRRASAGSAPPPRHHPRSIPSPPR